MITVKNQSVCALYSYMHLSNNIDAVIFNPEPLYNFVILDEEFSTLYNVKCAVEMSSHAGVPETQAVQYN
jgi:hypothetical protein